jgi:hypothetical protein
VPAQSTFFATAAEESYSTYQMVGGDGDLWPSCWGADGYLYAANGDGSAFLPAGPRYDMAVSRIGGVPPFLTGKTVATDVGTNYSGPGFNRKPTGMVCVNRHIYLAFQNLDFPTCNGCPGFNHAAAGSIAVSADRGVHWTRDKHKPMFPNSVFTTIFFLDYGRNNAHAIDHYVYAYGFDRSWRAQQRLYLARVPDNRIMNRPSWQFYAGTTRGRGPTWTRNIRAKRPVLTDTRLLYPVTFGDFCCSDGPVLGQGGVTYDAPLKRYIFSSWSFATHQFYESPRPWGPWRMFLSKDFGPFQMPTNRGQYGTSIPSKFISRDGRTMYVQSNECCRGDSYTFSLRKLYLSPYRRTSPTNRASFTNNLAVTGSETTAISKSTHFGTLCGLDCSDILNDGITSGQSEDDYDQEVKPASWWGYTWNNTYRMNTVVYMTGTMFPDGGWFEGGLRVQVRRAFRWVDVSQLSVSPAYPYDSSAGSSRSYTLSFQNTTGDGVRIIGRPGGSSHFTSISELAVLYRPRKHVDGG